MSVLDTSNQNNNGSDGSAAGPGGGPEHSGGGATDPFDPTRFRIEQDYAGILGGEKMLTHVPVGRPNKQVWFRVNPDPNFVLDVNVLVLDGDNEVYLVEPAVAYQVPHEVVAKRLFVYVTTQGDLGIWTVKLPDADGKLDGWNSSAMVAVDAAKKRWVRLVSNRNLGCYQPMFAKVNLADPNFGDRSFRDLLEIAFRGKVIDSPDHPVLRRLRGEA
ncbi:MAG TPA: hypothetical protein VH877_29375 [Polyangia bacterium]|jgi:hypothetical protein|nr:hypothetical protein [Polyangia bacterium]